MDKRTEINTGDIVEIQTGKYTGKKGKLTHIGGKYGVRVRVDLESTGEYTKVAEYRRPHISFKGYEGFDLASLMAGQSLPTLRKTEANKPKTIAYLKVSPRTRTRILKGDCLITPELTRLGRSALEVLDILKTAREKRIACFSVKEKMELKGDNDQAKMAVIMLSLFAGLERDFINMRISEALKARKDAGVQFACPKGPGRSTLDAHKDEIVAFLKTGVPKVRVASEYGVHRTTLENWPFKNKIKT